jgi:ABC-type multidrug transport system ATPase subunit
MAENPVPAIECKQVSKSFGGFLAIHNVNLQLYQKSITGVFGANGAGKTTLLKLLAGLLRPSSGDILARGLPIKEHSRAYLTSLGLLLDESFLYDDISLHENFDFHIKLHGRLDKIVYEEELHQLAKLFNISDWLDEPARILSRGMRRKADLVRTLLHEPDIVLLDEPYANLDATATRALTAILRDARDIREAIILLSSHDLSILKEICNRIIIMKKGTIVKTLEPPEFGKISAGDYA